MKSHHWSILFMNSLFEHISANLNEEIRKYISLSGGDISQAYKVSTQKQHYFLKLQPKKAALTMFQAEKTSLETIAGSNTIAVPQVYDVGLHQGIGYILMEYIEPKAGTADDFKTLATQLASMHKIHSQRFGFNHSNFIGSLAQSNSHCDNWTDFYLQERLLPQLELAVSKGLLNAGELPKNSRMRQELDIYFANCKPSLLHGDLWSGNFLFALDGTPYLIDPASYYGHHEVDIAMTRLFGGFHPEFYRTYQELLAPTDQTEARIALYQLYYLLVHLNLFGSTYYHSVKRIIKTYF